MKMIFKLAVLVPVLILMVLVDVPPELPSLQVQLVPDAHAILGVRRRSFRRGVAVGATAGAESASAASSSQTAQAQQQTAQAQQQTAATDKPLPLGTMVPSLPAGCTPTPVGGVEYYHCGGNYYRAAFQSNQLVYVTAKP